MGLKDHLMSTMAEASHISALLDRGCEFEGKLTFEGTVRINGIFSGEIFSNDLLIVGDTAVVHGEVDVDSIIISGEVHGNITTRNRMEIRRPAVVKGNLCTPVLTIEEGVIFEGNCRMPASAGRKREEPVNLSEIADEKKAKSA